MAEEDAHLDRDTLLRYAHGELTQQESKEIERHLADCSPCRKALSKALAPPPGAVDSQAGLMKGAPPTVELPETAEHREIPSQVSVMNIPQTIEPDTLPSHTSVVTGIGPTRDTTDEPAERRGRKPSKRKRKQRARRRGWIGCVVVVVLLAVGGGVAALVMGVRPRARSAALVGNAESTLAPVLDRARLEQLQHPDLRGTAAYRPGEDPALEQRLTDAEELLSRAVEADAGNTDARLLLALTHLLHGEPRVARQQYQEVEAIRGAVPETHLGLGILDYLAAGVAEDPTDRTYSLEQADAHFAAITLGDPGYPEAIYNRAAVALARDDRDEARRLLSVYAELRPGSPWIAELQRMIEPEKPDAT